MIDLPADLPAKPEGWTQHLLCHLNMGNKGHSAQFEIRDDAGRVMPFTYGYRTGKEPEKGFYLASSAALTWAELRKAWPLYLKSLRRLMAGGASLKEATSRLREEVPMVVIYDKPRDRPHGFVVRKWVVRQAMVMPLAVLGEAIDTIEKARELVPAGMINIGRADDDDPVVAEVWV